PSRISGFVRRSSLFTKSQPNLPLTQVDTPFAGASSCGSIFRISRSFVHTSNEQPTPQYVQTVFVFLIRSSRIVASTSETAMSEPYPVSIFFVMSTIGRNVSSAMPVRKPASPTMPTFITALHGQTVEQWPQFTHDDSSMVVSLSHMTRGLSSVQSISSVSFT